MVTHCSKSLEQLLQGLVYTLVQGELTHSVRSVVSDSRQVNPGSLFVALPGENVDGHRFVAQAAAAGAVAILISDQLETNPDVTLVRVPNTHLALAHVASRFFAEPSKSLCLVGITGTNGKTTLTYLLESILNKAERTPGVIGTVDVRWQDTRETSPHTTPQPVELQSWLRRMLDQGVQVALMEVSSHALSLHRVSGCHFRVGVFTNLSRDHLDFHGDLERYAQAKALLFGRELMKSEVDQRIAVVNADDPRAQQMLDGFSGTVFHYGCNPVRSIDEDDSVVSVRPLGEVKLDLSGIRLRVKLAGEVLDLVCPLVGQHNLENLLAAVAVSHALGIEPEFIGQGLQELEQVPGRLEMIPDQGGPKVFVDYAHTDHALQNVLEALAPLTPGRLIVVFGCGGDRDRGKRPLMGRAVSSKADLAIVTC